MNKVRLMTILGNILLQAEDDGMLDSRESSKLMSILGATIKEEKQKAKLIDVKFKTKKLNSQFLTYLMDKKEGEVSFEKLFNTHQECDDYHEELNIKVDNCINPKIFWTIIELENGS